MQKKFNNPENSGHAELMRLAVHAYKNFDFSRAEQLCKQVLQFKKDYFDALVLLGTIAAQTNRYQEAASLFGQVVILQPRFAAAHNNLGVALKELGQPHAAIKSYDTALQIKPDYLDAYNNRGVALQGLKKFDAALASFDRALKIDRRCAEAHMNRGMVLEEMGQFDAALASHDLAINIKPDYAEAYSNRGVTLHRLGQLREAIASYETAIGLYPNYTEAINNCGNTFRDLGQTEAALACYEKAIAIFPDYAEAYNNKGLILQELKKFDAALSSYDRAISIKPDYAEAHSNRGTLMKDFKRLDEAISCYQKAIGLKTDYAEAYNNLGNALKELGSYEEALVVYEKALAIKPDYSEAYSNRGTLFMELKKIDKALESYGQAIFFDPKYADAYWNKSLALLCSGDLGSGWDLYEWRWKKDKNKSAKKTFFADWDGASVAGAILVLPEQGVGDQIFYSGMLGDLRKFASSITVIVDPRLVELYQRSFVDIDFIPNTQCDSIRGFDAQAYMPSLGQFLRRDIASICVPRGYLRACAEQVKSLKAVLGVSKQLTCGLSWSSKNSDIGDDKSVRLADLAPLLAIENIKFVNLQYGDTSKEQEEVRVKTGMTLESVKEVDNFNDLDGLAALISACDVVVTISNTTAHLAAALGKTVFVMLPYSVGLLWYWHDTRCDSPWYPSARLYRQERRGQWGDVLERVQIDLEAISHAKGR